MTAVETRPLPFTVPCSITGNFPGEYTKSLRWKCDLYDGHDGACLPTAFDRRLYNYRLSIVESYKIPDSTCLSREMIQHVVDIAVSEARDSDGLDAGVMWLRINRYIAFANYLRMVCP